MSTKSIEGPEGTIEYKGEVEIPLEEENEVETVFDVSETEIDVESVESVESVELEVVTDSTNVAEIPTFTEMTQEEKKELTQIIPDAEEVNYIYKPEQQSDSAKIGNVDIPKWFAYLCFGIIIATLLSMCYIANQNKKKMYYGRRD